MSRSALKGIQAAAGAAAGGTTYVDDVFSTYAYTGVYSNTDIVNDIDLSGEGGLVWTKKRNSTRSHDLCDTERGVTKSIYSNNSDVEGTDSQGLLAFNSNGYRIGGSSSYNNTSDTYVSWTFRKQPGFFDVVTWTGNGVSGRQIPHNLGSVPGMIIVKNLSLGSADWRVFHRSLGPTKNVLLNGTNAALTQTGMWNDTAPTSTVFTVGNDGGVNSNASTYNYVAYIFAHDAQDFGENSDEAIIKCGSYTGNTSSKPNIDLGFEPQWVMIKCTTHSESWIILDSMRGIVTPDSPSGTGEDARLLANTSGAEYSASSTSYIKLHANGFELTGTGGEINAASRDYIYVAIARPHKPASELTATDLFKPATGNFTSQVIQTGFPVDLFMSIQTTNDNYNRWIPRITEKTLYSDLSNSEASESYTDFAQSEGMGLVYSGNISGFLYYNFKRAPGFFDVVTYIGTGSARTINHNLGAVPQLMLIKGRNASFSWDVYAEPIGNTKKLSLNGTGAATSSSSEYWNNTTPTDSVFSLGTGLSVNNNNSTFIAYLFASVAGISKVGTYTGTGSDLNVDCGFSSGARFVMVKRTDSTGDWYFWDTARGIVAGNDPYHRFNVGISGGADVTNTDYIDPLSSGFTITSSAPAEINASGGTYIFFAIA